jgi:hypothetical protein
VEDGVLNGKIGRGFGVEAEGVGVVDGTVLDY